VYNTDGGDGGAGGTRSSKGREAKGSQRYVRGLVLATPLEGEECSQDSESQR
jgi:hypothetical protein